jgi:hypothetical protein
MLNPYQVYISGELLKTLQIDADVFPGKLVSYLSLTDVYVYHLQEADVELAKEVLRKNTGVNNIEFDGEVFLARRASEDN